MKYNSHKRPIQQELGSSFKTLHDVLLMMENDEENYKLGCNWGYVKRNVTSSQIIDMPEDSRLTIESAGDAVITMKKKGSLASQFLTNVRNGFAHNCIAYDSQSDMLTFDVNDSSGGLALQGKISHSALIEIVNLIKESKTNFGK